MKRKTLLLMMWFPLALIFQGLLLVNLIRFTENSQNQTLSMESLYTLSPKTDRIHIQIARAFENEAQNGQIVETAIMSGDARPLLVERLLHENESPMKPYAAHLVAMADKYEVDWQLTTAIAGCESTFGKHVPLKAGHNAWGIAVFTGTQEGAEFDNWTHGIESATRLIKERYKDKGLTGDLLKMGSVWAPPSVYTNNSWAKCVQFFKDKLQ